MVQRSFLPDTLLGITVVCIGLFFAICGIYDHFYGITPENQLVMAEGVPHDLEETSHTGKYDTKYILSFSVKDLRTHITSTDSAAALFGIVKSAGPIQIFVSPKRESLLFNKDMTLYKLVKNGTAFVTYAQTVSYKSMDSKYYWIGAAIFLIMGVVAFQYKRMTENYQKQIAAAVAPYK